MVRGWMILCASILLAMPSYADESIDYIFDQEYFSNNIEMFTDSEDPMEQLACIVSGSLFSKEAMLAFQENVKFDALKVSTRTPVEIKVEGDQIYWPDANASYPIIAADGYRFTVHPYIPARETLFEFTMTPSGDYTALSIEMNGFTCWYPFLKKDLMILK